MDCTVLGMQVMTPDFWCKACMLDISRRETMKEGAYSNLLTLSILYIQF